MNVQPFSIRQALKFGLKATFDNFGVILGALAIVFLSFFFWCILLIIPLISMGFATAFGEKTSLSAMNRLDALMPAIISHWHVMLFFFMMTLVLFALQACYNLGAIRMSLSYYDTHTLAVKDLFTEWRSIPAFLVAKCVFSIAVSFGILLFLIPGLFWATIFSLYAQALVDRHDGPFACMRYSLELTRGARKKVFLWVLTEWFFMAIAVKLFFVTLIFVWPMIIFANAYIYRKLQYHHEKMGATTY